MNNTNLLSDIIIICKKYIEDPLCVYKMVIDKDKCYLVILSKTPNTLTNETSDDRKYDVINQNHASYRATELKVLLILNIYDLDDKPMQVTNTFHGRISRYQSEKHTVQYILNEIVKGHRFDFEDNQDMYGRSSGGGIYYYKTLETAYYNAFRINNYTGKWYHWKNNGELDHVNEIVNGQVIM